MFADFGQGTIALPFFKNFDACSTRWFSGLTCWMQFNIQGATSLGDCRWLPNLVPVKINAIVATTTAFDLSPYIATFFLRPSGLPSTQRIFFSQYPVSKVLKRKMTTTCYLNFVFNVARQLPETCNHHTMDPCNKRAYLARLRSIRKIRKFLLASFNGAMRYRYFEQRQMLTFYPIVESSSAETWNWKTTLIDTLPVEQVHTVAPPTSAHFPSGSETWEQPRWITVALIDITAKQQ